RCVRSCERAAAGGREQLGGALADSERVVVERAEIRAQPPCLLHVVADDLRKLEDAVAELRLEPGREAQVQVGPASLGRRAVGDVPDEQVAEAVGPLAVEART